MEYDDPTFAMRSHRPTPLPDRHGGKPTGGRRPRRLLARICVGAAATLVAASGALLGAPAAHAENVWQVNTNVDRAPVGSDCVNGNPCPLRSAIALSNAAGGTNTIVFSPSVTSPIVLSQGRLELNGSPAQTLTIAGSGPAVTVIDANHASAVFAVNGGATLILSQLTARNGGNVGNGGGILNFGSVFLTNSVLSGNNVASSGGGVYSQGGSLTLSNSTLSGNSAGSFGGGIYNLNGTTTVSNSTMSGNSARDGGAIANVDTLKVTNGTVSGNSATEAGGGIDSTSPATATIANSIVAVNTAPAGGENCSGTITDGANNLENGATCGFHLNFVQGDPHLGPLQNNGGATPTQSITETSPAFDQGNAAACDAAPVNGIDQRGSSRVNEFPGDAECDIGAYETLRTLTVAGEGGDGAGWSGGIPGGQGFTGLGGQLIGAPAILWISSASTHLYVGVGTDHQLYQRTDAAGWQRLTSAFTSCFDNPGAYLGAGGMLWIGCEGSDHALWTTTATTNGSGLATNVAGFTSRGGILSAGPSLTRLPNTTDVVGFVVGTDTRVYTIDLTANQGFVANPNGWRCQGHVGVVFDPATSLTYFACDGTDGHLWVSVNSNGTFGATRPGGGALVNGVGIAPGNTNVVVVVQGTDHHAWYTTSDSSGNTNGFTSRGGIFETGLLAAHP